MRTYNGQLPYSDWLYYEGTFFRTSRDANRRPWRYNRAMIGAAHDYELLIREQHLDTFGHVNNAKYLEIFEEARWDLITRNGYGLAEVQRRKIGPTILEIKLRFLRELRNRQRITIRTWVESYAGKVGTLMQQILDEQGNLCCEMTMIIGLFDVTARKLIPPTPEWLKAMGITEADLTPAKIERPETPAPAPKGVG
jgi:acyl-CoA thioester hydrolase